MGGAGRWAGAGRALGAGEKRVGTFRRAGRADEGRLRAGCPQRVPEARRAGFRFAWGWGVGGAGRAEVHGARCGERVFN